MKTTLSPALPPPTAVHAGASLMRKCACGTHTPAGAECTACVQQRLQRRAAVGRQADGAIPAEVHDVLAAQGQGLDAATRAFMEPRFGRDFSGVRVHADAQAAASAHAVAAHAYTVGRHIVFGAGGYAPVSRRGRELLAHELTHVVQQSGASGALPAGDLTVDPSPAAEQEARAVASAVMNDGAATASPRAGVPGLQRLPLSLQRGADHCGGAGGACASEDACATADSGAGAGLGDSTAWALTVNIDTERDSWESALRNQEFGHTFVRFSENSGRQYTYGFYPAKDLPNETRRTVPGCVRHPDASHDSCTDRKVTYSLDTTQYAAALAAAQKICADGHDYGVAYTCTTYAADVAKAAGQSLPSSTSAPTEVFYQQVPRIDNPNTLKDNVDAEITKDPAKKGFWNAKAPPSLRLRPVGPVALDGDPNSPVFRLDWMPVEGATFRWHLYGAASEHYLMKGASGDQEPLDWLSFTTNSSAIIGRKTRDLLKQRKATAGSVQCAVRFDVQGWSDQVAVLPVSFG